MKAYKIKIAKQSLEMTSQKYYHIPQSGVEITQMFQEQFPGEYNLIFAPPPLRGKKSKIRNQEREFKTCKEKEG